MTKDAGRTTNDERRTTKDAGRRTFFFTFYFLLFPFYFLTCNVYAQDSTDVKAGSGEIKNILPSGLSLMNQMRYSNDYQRELAFFEDWLNVDYRSEIFSGGLRLVSFQPKDPSVGGTKRKYTEIDFAYLKMELGDEDEGMVLNLGNYYAMFGRGMILKSYENRNIRVDNNLLGGKLSLKYHGLTLTALTGLPENLNGERKDLLYAADMEYELFSYLRTGITFAYNKPDAEGTAGTSVFSARIEPSVWNFDLYGEYALKQNADDKRMYFSSGESFTGKAFYSSMNFYYGSFSFFGEYKLYDNFFFGTSDQSVSYNTPPAGRKDYSFSLLNRHPSPLNQNNEKGFQFEINYYFGSDIFLTANYGETKTLSPGSYYQIISNSSLVSVIQLKESLIQASVKWNEYLSTTAGLAYNEELSANTKNITPVLETRLYLGSVNTLRFVIEHQQTKNRTTEELYYTDLVTLEYSRAPKFSAALITEMSTHEPEAGRIVRSFWNYIQLGYNFMNNTDLILTIGSRQAGAICAGGVCRYEPEFHGLEIKMLTRL